MKQVTIKRNDYDEYEVPTPSAQFPDSIYFTDDKADAIDTARAHWFINRAQSEINVRVIRGSYHQ